MKTDLLLSSVSLLPSSAGEILLIAVAVVVLGISKTGFGGGIGILVIPLIGIVLPAGDMLGVVAILLIAVDVFAPGRCWAWSSGTSSCTSCRR